MANSDKNIKITPNISQTAQPNVVFTGQGNVPITLKVLDDSYGTLSFEGSAGQLFSINNNLTTGVIFSVNDVSGIPQIDVNADGTIRIAPFGSNLQIAGLTIGRGSGGVISNTAFGGLALSSALSTSYDNSAFGYQALKANTSGVGNVAVGSVALAANTTGSANVAVGRAALASATTAGANVVVGDAAGSAITTGYYNTGLGHQVLLSTVTGSNNVAVGYQTLSGNTSSANVGVGAQALPSVTSGSSNVGVGNNCFNFGNGSNNLFLGHRAGMYQADGTTGLGATSSSVYIGYQSRGFNDSDSNSVVIGANAIGKGANTTVLGNTSTTQTWLYGSNRLPFNSASGLSTFNVAKTVLGGIHFVNGAGTNTSTRNEAAITFQGSADTEAQAGIYVTNDNSTGTHMAFATTDSYATGPQLAMTINNVGVVNFLRTQPTYTGSKIAYGSGTIGYLTKYFNDSSGITNSLIYDNGTNIGIGTTSPGAKLEIQTADGADSLAMSGYKVMKWESNNHLVYGGYTAGQWQILKFFTNGSERFRVDASGNFGIGNTSPGARLQVDTGATGTTGLIVKGFTGQTAALQTFQNSSGEVIDFVAADGYSSIHFGEIDWTPNYSGGVSSPSAKTYQKTSGNANAWDGQVYSSQGFIKNVHVTFKPSQNNLYFMLGLNSDPDSNASYGTIDYCWYCNNDGYMYIYENGGQVGSNYGTYTSSTLLTIAYDGVNVTYYKDGAIMRQVARAVGNALYLDSSFYSLNAAANSVRFGPLAPNVAAQGTANYVAKFNAANSLVNSTIQDDGTTVTITNALVANSVATPRYYSYSVNAGNAVRLGQWFVNEGTVALHIQVSSDTGSNSGTSSYLYQGGFNVISNTSGQYVKLLPLMIGRGHGDGPDASVSSTDAGGWTVFLYTGTTNPAYTMGVAVGVPTGKANKALRVTVTELRGGMTYTADGSSIAYPTTSYPYTLQHSYGAISSAGAISASGIIYPNAGIYTSAPDNFISQTAISQQVSEYTRSFYRQLPDVVGDYVDFVEVADNAPARFTIDVSVIQYPAWTLRSYDFTTTWGYVTNGVVPPSSTSNSNNSLGFDFELETISLNSYYRRFRIKRTRGTTTNVYAMIYFRMVGVYVTNNLTVLSSTGTSALSSYVGKSYNYSNPNIYAPPPAGYAGAGVNLTLSASSGVTSGAGGSIILQPGNATSGLTPGKVIIDGPGGVPATRTVQLDISSNYAIARYYRALPNTVGDYVELFQNYMNSHAQMRITVNAWRPTSGSSHSTKVYEWNNNYGYVNGSIPPVYSYPGGLVVDSDFELEVNRNLSTSYNEYRLRRTAGTVNYQAYITVECFNYQHSISEISGTGTSALGLSYIGYPTRFTTAISAPAPCGYSGSGNTLNLYGSSAVNSGNGGGITLYAANGLTSGAGGAVALLAGLNAGSGYDKGYISIGDTNGFSTKFYNFYRTIPATQGDYVEVCMLSNDSTSSIKYLEIEATVWQHAYWYAFKRYVTLVPYASFGLFQPCVISGNDGFELELAPNGTDWPNPFLRVRRTAATGSTANIYINIKTINGRLKAYSGTGTSTLGNNWVGTYQTFMDTVGPGYPATGSGAGRNFTVTAGAAVGTGAGGSLILKGTNASTTGAGGSVIIQPGAQATTGGDGYLQIKGQGNSTVIKITESAYNRSFTWTQDYSGASLSADGGLGGIILFSRFYVDTGGKIRSAYNNYVGLGNSNSQNYDNWGYIYLRNDGVINWWGDVGLTYGSVGQIRVSDASTGGGSLAFTSSTASYSANQNDLALTGSAFQRLAASGGLDRTITGIAPPSGGSHVDGRMMRIYNVGSANSLILAHNSTSSAANNRLWCVGQANITIALGDYAELIYDANDNGRGGAGWRVH